MLVYMEITPNLLPILKVHQKIMCINMFVDNDPMLKTLYLEAAQKHNQKIAEDPLFYDAGFDLFLPEISNMFSKEHINKVDFKVKCCAMLAEYVDSDLIGRPTPFYTYARSSLSKTPLRLANNQGVIDAGYRGNLIGMFDCLSDAYSPEPNSRLLQICAPGLLPIYVSVVETMDGLGPSTARGEGGFGSTGK